MGVAEEKGAMGSDDKEAEQHAMSSADAATDNELLDMLLNCDDPALRNAANDYVERTVQARTAAQLRALAEDYNKRFKK
jgi:hypothetical protein